MHELKQVAENRFYIQSPAKIGLVKLNGTEVCPLDGKNDKGPGGKFDSLLMQIVGI